MLQWIADRGKPLFHRVQGKMFKPLPKKRAFVYLSATYRMVTSSHRIRIWEGGQVCYRKCIFSSMSQQIGAL